MIGKIGVIGFFVGLSLAQVRGDLVTLTTGNDIFCEVISEGEITIKIKTPTGNIEFPKERVSNITKEKPAVTYSKFGKYYLDRKDYTKAIDYYNMALKSDPANSEYTSKLDLANKLSQSMSASKADVLIETGDRYLTLNQTADAIDSYAKITTLNLGESWTRKAMQKIAHVQIVLANRADEPGQREALVNKALVLDPQSAEAHYEKGMIYLQKSNNDAGKKEFEESLHIDPTFAKSHRILGNLYYIDQKYLEATDQYDQLKKLSPDLYQSVKQNLTNSYQLLGNQAYQSKKYDEARLWYEKYLELDPTGTWSLLYKTQYQLKKFDLDPTSAEAHFNLGLWCQDKNLQEEALVEYKTAVKLDPLLSKAKRKMVELYDKFASSLYQTGVQSLNAQKYAQAIQSFAKVSSDFPESSFAPEARRLVSVSREKWAENIYSYAKSNFESNYFDKAYQGFSQIVQEFPDTNRFVDAQRMLARTKSKIRFEEVAGSQRKQRMDDLNKIIDSSTGEDKQAWDRIKELQEMPQWDFEARLTNLTQRERTLVHRNLDKVIYLFYDSDKGIDKLRPIGLKYSLPVSDRSKVKSDADYAKVLQLALMLGTSIGGDYYEAWQELIPYFGTSRSELEDARSGLSDDAKRLIEERGQEVYRLLNLRSN